MLPYSQIIKGSAHVLTTLGVSKLVSEFVRNNTVQVTVIDKVLILAGKIAVGTVITEVATRSVSRNIDKALNAISEKIEKDSPDTTPSQ